MKTLRNLVLCLIFFCAVTRAEAPWMRSFEGEAATGSHVIALYRFDSGAELRDASGNGHDLKLRGRSRTVEDGKFGGCLESYVVGKEEAKPVGAEARDHDALSPKGAFTLELWFRAKPEIVDQATSFLLDKKYFHYRSDRPGANNDYCLLLRRVSSGAQRLVALLGFGKDSVEFVSDDIAIVPGKWNHVAFAYDGSGTGRLFWNGECVGRARHRERGAIAPGPHALAIGDRKGSTHHGCAGWIDEVRISNGVPACFRGTLEVETERQRTVFVRMEENAALALLVVNDSGETVNSGDVSYGFPGEQRSASFDSLPHTAELRLPVEVNTTLKPGTYPMQVCVRGRTAERTVEVTSTIAVTIVPRPLPNVMPVVMWGTGDLPTLKDIGFTHQIVGLVSDSEVWKAGQPTPFPLAAPAVCSKRRMLDDYLKEGIGAVVRLYPGRWVVRDKELKEIYQRINAQGEPNEHANVCASFPEVQRFAYNVGASTALAYGDMPGLSACLVHSEIRDHTSICFHDHDREAFRSFAGYDIPPQCVSKSGVSYAAIPDFPSDRVVPDDDRILTFYRWFWKDGDGWNPLHTQVHRGLKSTGRNDIWTFFDPAVRAPSIWGSGGGVDILSQWTYSYPDPIKIGQAADELFAMADGGPPGQDVMKMTQIIWYRSRTAPTLPEDESKRVQWEKDLPDARFITISPDHLREALWCKLARPVRGIMYHGWGSLVKAKHGSYQFTNPETRHALSDATRNIVRPLGPTLLQIPDRKTDVALLESFSSQVFAGRGSRGWSQGWEADMHLILQWAQLQPRIVYDETILRDGLDDYSVLVMPNCDVLTAGVVDAIRVFQKRGGLVVADENTCPAILPDLLVQSYRRTGKADKDKAALQAKAAQLRHELDPFYVRHAVSDNPDVVTRLRRYGSTDYLFAINDHRAFGNYVGQHGLVMEKGLPSQAALTVRRERGFVYDLTAGKSVETTQTDDGLRLDADLGPGQGRLFMVSDRPIHALRVSGPGRVRAGDTAVFKVRIASTWGRRIDAVVPVHLRILDPDGHEAEPSGYYGAADGVLTVAFDVAPNDMPGTWTCHVSELASGLSQTHDFRLAP